MSNLPTVPKVYDKIRDSRRDELIRMVEIYKVQMKLAAQQLGIKYSTARHILKQYRIHSSEAIRPKALNLSLYANPIMRNLTSYIELSSQINPQEIIGDDEEGSDEIPIKDDLVGLQDMLVDFTRSELLEPELLKKKKTEPEATFQD